MTLTSKQLRLHTYIYALDIYALYTPSHIILIHQGTTTAFSIDGYYEHFMDVAAPHVSLLLLLFAVHNVVRNL